MKYTVILLVRKFGAPPEIQKIWRKEDEDAEYKLNSGILWEEGEMLQQGLWQQSCMYDRSQSCY